MKVEYLGVLYGILKRKEALLEFIRRMERREIWIQPFPCWAVLNEKLLEYATFLAKKDFEKGINKARKLNVQILLRFTGDDQIRDAIQKLEIKNDQNLILAIVSKEESLKETKERIETKSIMDILGKEDMNTTPDLKKIKLTFGFTPRYLSAICKSRERTDKEVIERALMEQMALLNIK